MPLDTLWEKKTEVEMPAISMVCEFWCWQFPKYKQT